MSDKATAIKENYSKNFKAVNYIAKMAGNYKDDPDFLLFSVKFLKEVLDSGRFKGSSLLEIGSGALVHNIANASAFFPNIVMSDYVEDNVQELRRWLKGQSSLTQFLDVPAELEGYRGDLETGKRLIEQRIRQNVKQVVRCDVLTDGIFLEELKPELAPPYDLIFSILCLEAAVPDVEGLGLALKRISKLLRPGGGLVLVGFLRGQQWYVIGGNKYPYIQVTEDDVVSALRESGFGNIDFKTRDKFSINYDHDKYYCIAAEKM